MEPVLDQLIRGKIIGTRFYDPDDQLSAMDATQEDFADDTFSTQYYGDDDGLTLVFKTGLEASRDTLAKKESSPQKISYENLPHPRQRDIDGFLRFISLLTAPGRSFDKDDLSILDFGGHTGTLFYLTKPFVNIKRWHVIEFPSTCKRGEKIRDGIDPSLQDVLTFSPDLPESLADYVAVMNGVVMHLPDPLAMVHRILSRAPRAFWLGNVFELHQGDVKALTPNPVLVASGEARSGKGHVFSIVPHGYYSDIARGFFSRVMVSARGYAHPCLYRNTKTDSAYLCVENAFDYFYFN